MAGKNHSYAEVETQFITAANGIKFAYHRMGEKIAVPIVLFNHLTSNLDNADPRIMDALAAGHEIIAFDYRGVGVSSGVDAWGIFNIIRISPPSAGILRPLVIKINKIVI